MKTDAQLQQDVIEELKWEQSVDASHIGVEVSGGVVTLAGHVDSFAEKWNAEQAAQRVTGVKALAVEISVTLPGSSKRNDVDIARSIENVIEWSAYLPRDHVKVMVEGGWVTLTGEVDWAYQKQAVAAGLRGLMGVTGVSNEIWHQADGIVHCRQGRHRGCLEETCRNQRGQRIGCRRRCRCHAQWDGRQLV